MSKIDAREANPALDALAAALQTSFTVLKVVMVLIVFGYLGSGVFQVNSYQQALIFRYGKLDRIVGEGPHLAWPAPIERVQKVTVLREQSLEIKDLYFKKATSVMDAPGPTLSPINDGYLITGDTNIVNVAMTVHYRIADLRSYYSAVGSDEQAQQLLRLAVKNGALGASTTMAVDPLLRHGAIRFKDAVEAAAKASLQRWESGIEIASIEVAIVPPLQVKSEFDKVLQAEQNKSEKIATAEGAAQRIINQSRGDIGAVIADAQTAAAQSLAQARADAKYLQTVMDKYGDDRAALELFVANTRFARLKRILSSVQAKYFLPEGSRELQLRLGLDPQRIKKDEEEAE